jgi:hypothetical protein
LQQGGKRRSRPLPTKAIDEAVGECGSDRQAQGNLASVGRAFNVGLTGSGGNGMVGLLIQGAHSADATMDDNAAQRRVIVVPVDLGAGHE